MMKFVSRMYRLLGIFIILSMVSVFVGIQHPTMPAVQAAKGIETISQDNAFGPEEFGAGAFRRTALSARQFVGSSPGIEDLPGGIQLMPLGALTKFKVLEGRLPAKIFNMGVVTMGKYVVLLGGSERIETGAEPTSDRMDKVWVGEFDTTSGTPPSKDDWDVAPSLPSVQHINFDPTDFTFPFSGGIASATSSPAVVAVPDSNNPENGYIYVIGGFVKPADLDENISSAATRIARFENGTLTWQDAGPMLPIPDNPEYSYGVHAATAQTVQVGGKTYIYVIGGLQNYLDLENNINGVRYIFYAEVGANGRLKNPTPNNDEETWAVMRYGANYDEAPITVPIPDGATFPEMGHWSSSAVQYADPSGEQGIHLYLFGGQRRKNSVTTDPFKYSSFIYRAKVEDDGRLTWSRDWEGSLPANSITGMAAQSFNDNIYIAGGQSFDFTTGAWVAAEEYQDVISNFIDENMEIDLDTFAANDMLRYRFNNGLSIIQSTNSTSSTLAYFYVLGGRSNVFPDDHAQAGQGTDPGDPYSHLGTDTILFSRIDPDDAIPVYSKKGGWYYSRPIDVERFNNPETDKTGIASVYWSAAVSRTAEITTDVKLEYRVDQTSCNQGGVFGGQDWRPLTRTLEFTSSQTFYYSDKDGGSSGELRAQDKQIPINCFQYRAQLLTQHENYTPVLLNVGLEVATDKEPDLYVSQLQPRREEDTNVIVDLDITIENFFEEDKTADADFDGNSSKQFFVDLYVFSPDQESYTEDNPPPNPFIEGKSTILTPTHHLYATFPRSQMPAGATFPPDPNKQEDWVDADGNGRWKDVKTNDSVLTSDLIASLTEKGTYQACVVVDSYITADDEAKWPNGYVNEGDEEHNWMCIDVEIDVEPLKVCLMKTNEGNAKEYDKDEEIPIQGTYTITRSVIQGGDLEVFFDLSGSASFTPTLQTGQPDYNFDKEGGKDVITFNNGYGSIIIPEGSYSKEFSFTPVDDSIHEEIESVTLKITNNPEGETPYQAVDISEMECNKSKTIFIEDNDWNVFLPLVVR